MRHRFFAAVLSGCAMTAGGEPFAPPMDAVNNINRAYWDADVQTLEQLIAVDYLHSNSGGVPVDGRPGSLGTGSEPIDTFAGPGPLRFLR